MNGVPDSPPATGRASCSNGGSRPNSRRPHGGGGGGDGGVRFGSPRTRARAHFKFHAASGHWKGCCAQCSVLPTRDSQLGTWMPTQWQWQHLAGFKLTIPRRWPGRLLTLMIPAWASSLAEYQKRTAPPTERAACGRDRDPPAGRSQSGRDALGPSAPPVPAAPRAASRGKGASATGLSVLRPSGSREPASVKSNNGNADTLRVWARAHGPRVHTRWAYLGCTASCR